MENRMIELLIVKWFKILNKCYFNAIVSYFSVFSYFTVFLVHVHAIILVFSEYQSIVVMFAVQWVVGSWISSLKHYTLNRTMFFVIFFGFNSIDRLLLRTWKIVSETADCKKPHIQLTYTNIRIDVVDDNVSRNSDDNISFARSIYAEIKCAEVRLNMHLACNKHMKYSIIHSPKVTTIKL